MKKVSIISSLVLILAVLIAIVAGRGQNDPKDLRYWFAAGDGKDWSAEAANGDAQAQFFVGVRSIRTNLLTMIDRVP